MQLGDVDKYSVIYYNKDYWVNYGYYNHDNWVTGKFMLYRGIGELIRVDMDTEVELVRTVEQCVLDYARLAREKKN